MAKPWALNVPMIGHEIYENVVKQPVIVPVPLPAAAGQPPVIVSESTSTASGSIPDENENFQDVVEPAEPASKSPRDEAASSSQGPQSRKHEGEAMFEPRPSPWQRMAHGVVYAPTPPPGSSPVMSPRRALEDAEVFVEAKRVRHDEDMTALLVEDERDLCVH